VGQAPPAPPQLCWQPGRDGEAACRPATLCPRRCHLRNNFGFEVQQKELILTLPTPRARIPARTHLVLRVGRVCSFLALPRCQAGDGAGLSPGRRHQSLHVPFNFPPNSWSLLEQRVARGKRDLFSCLTFVPLSCRCQCPSPSRCMCGNNMSVPLLADAVTVSGAERETAAVRAGPFLPHLLLSL